jgi:hypothetical protein
MARHRITLDALTPNRSAAARHGNQVSLAKANALSLANADGAAIRSVRPN